MGTKNSETDETAAETSIFTTTSEVRVTREEKWRRYLDEFLLTPFRIIWSDWRTRIGITIITGYVFMGILALTILDPPVHSQAASYMTWFENWAYPLGTNRFGTGYWRLVAYATLPMLEMVFAGAVFSTTIALFVGTFSGYKGGDVDKVLMTITDVAMTMPGLPLVIVVVSIFSPERAAIIGILLSINAWAGLARTIRSQVLSLRQESYVEASRVTGMSTKFILTKDIIPPLMPYITISFMNAARGVIFGAIGLYFLGLLPYSRANWGVMLDNAYSAVALSDPSQWFQIAIPLLTILFFSISLVLFAQGLDQVFNPRIRARHADTGTEGDEEPDTAAETVQNPATTEY